MNQPRTTRRKVDGVLLLDKPLGLSSNQALQKARWLLNALKAGHTGVLDPLATGLLPLCFGEATKFAQRMLDADKRYVATLRLGIRTRTGDVEGEPISVRPVQCDAEAIRRVIAGFVGHSTQLPPMYSALKHEGKALYEYARQGVDIAREKRPITLHAIEVLEMGDDWVTIDVQCSKGTYIRVLAEDIGEQLGCGAHLTALRRTRTAGFSLNDAITLETLEAMPGQDRTDLLQPVDALVADLPAIPLDRHQTEAIRHGRPVPCGKNRGIIPLLRLYGASVGAEAPEFLGVGELGADGVLHARRLLSSVVASSPMRLAHDGLNPSHNP